MLTIDRLVADATAAPLVVRIGVVALVLSGVADVVTHLAAPAATGIDEHTAAELAAHLAGFVSMVVILLGVVVDGVRRSRARRGQRGHQPTGAS
jgi:hypothetical protein